jgi:hypothetical protein
MSRTAQANISHSVFALSAWFLKSQSLGWKGGKNLS